MIRVGGKVKYVFVCSAARSGSTITDILLGGHQLIASTGELVFLGRSLALNLKCSCGSPLQQCMAWGKVLDLLAKRHGVDLRQYPYGMEQWLPRAFNNIDRSHQNNSYLLRRKLLMGYVEVRRSVPAVFRDSLPLPSILKRGIENTYRIYQAVKAAWDVDVVVDSSKNIRQAYELYRHDPNAFRIIFLVRDGRGVFNSGIKSGYGLRQSLNSWLLYNDRTLKWLEELIPEEHVFQLKYERLIGDTAQVMQELCDFLGLIFDPKMTDLSYGERHIFEGNDTRFFRDRPLKLDEKWQRELNQKDLAFFTKHAGFLNQKLGYLE